MVTVLSMSPAVDRRLEVEAFHVGGTNRVASVSQEGAGKGINVALGVHGLGLNVRCIGLLAGAGEAVKERLDRNGVAHSFLQAPGTVRTNLKLFDRGSDRITEISEASPEAPPELLGKARDAAVDAARDSDFLVLTGSLPTGCPPDFYGEIIRRAKKEAPDCRCVLDAGGEHLFQGVRAGAWLVKPNLSELEQLMGKPLKGREAVLTAARELLSQGVQVVVVSMGEEGAVALAGNAVYEAAAIPARVRTTTGAGDAMVAGLIKGFAMGLSLESVLRSGVAAATARCTYGGDGFLRDGDYRGFLSQVEVR